MLNVFCVRLPRVVLGGLLLMVVASPAQAQLGRLKKLGADAVKDAAKDKLAGKKDTATVAPATASSSGGGTSAKKVDLALTDDRIALVVASLQPMVAEAQKREELARVTREYRAKTEATNKCMEAATKSFNPMTMGSMSEKTQADLERAGARTEAAQKRLSAAIERQDRRAQLFLQDTVNVLLQRSAYLTMGAKCTIDFTPTAIIEAQIAAQSRTVVSEDMDSDTFDPPAVAKEQLTRYQYAVIRERIALWALQQDNPTLKGVGKEGVFTAEEQAALAANAADIKKLTPYFKSGSMRWSTWGDLKAW